MPLLSLVLAVHGDQAYIAECAGSILGQDFADLELIAIDDASPGHAPALLDDLAARDSRVTVRHLPERIGRGEARNIGLDAAQGDYVWFVNATDLLPPGAVQLVAERLREDGPDVLVVDHVAVDSLRRRKAGPKAKGLDAAPRAFDKVFRRTAIAGRFGPGAHDELTLTWPTMLHAARIAALPQVAYERRTPDNATPEGDPFDVFAQYEAVLREAGDKRKLVHGPMLRHLLALLDEQPDGKRRDFFRWMSQLVEVAPGRAGQMVKNDRYLMYQGLQRYLGVRAKLRKRATKRDKDRLARHYAAERRKPIDPDLAVFAAYWYRGYSCNPRAIYEKARELVPGMRGVWVVKRDAAKTMPEGVEFVVEGTPEYFSTLARAHYFVNNVNYPNHLVKRDGTVHVMTHHGTPLKKMGMDQRESPVSGAKIDFAAMMRRTARWDFSVSANVFSTLAWERAYPAQFESLETGYPRNDVLANATASDVEAAREELSIKGEGRKVVLYTPTHREWHDGFKPVIDIAKVAEALGPDYLILARAHYFYDAPAGHGGEVRDVSKYPSVEELMLAADVLVTDYSSIMFDYAVLDRPVVIHAADWDVYRTLRGTYFDLMEEPPGPIARSEQEVAAHIRAGDIGADLRAAFRAKFCDLEDGRAAERVVRRVWLGEPVPAKAERVPVATV